MPIPVLLKLEGIELEGELFDTPASKALLKRLPMRASLSRWGDGFCGDVGSPLGSLPGETQEVMEVGDLAIWPPGNAFCLFFGPTPVSRGDEPRAASEVHRIGLVHGDLQLLKDLGQGVNAILAQKI
jgi:hypothetical protein